MGFGVCVNMTDYQIDRSLKLSIALICEYVKFKLRWWKAIQFTIFCWFYGIDRDWKIAPMKGFSDRCQVENSDKENWGWVGDSLK